jgi:hypothetical protein
MIESLIESIKSRWEDLKCFTIMEAFEGGVIWRMGKYQRDMYVGINWKWPLIEAFKVSSQQDIIKTLPSQSIDGWVITPVVCYYIKNVNKYWMKVFDEDDGNVDDISSAVIAEKVVGSEISPYKLLPEILQEVREQCSTYGLRVRSLSFSTCDKLSTYRLILDKDISVE